MLPSVAVSSLRLTGSSTVRYVLCTYQATTGNESSGHGKHEINVSFGSLKLSCIVGFHIDIVTTSKSFFFLHVRTSTFYVIDQRTMPKVSRDAPLSLLSTGRQKGRYGSGLCIPQIRLVGTSRYILYANIAHVSPKEY